MKDWLRGPRGGLLAFLVITGLVAGALGWATAAALRVEQEQLAERATAEHEARLRLALWRLDSRIAPHLARENNRPFDHYSAIFAPPLAFDNVGVCQTPGTMLEPSPLLGTELPEWMLLHFQLTSKGWESPQAPAPSLLRRLIDPRTQAIPPNVTEQRRQLLGALAHQLSKAQLLALARERTEPATLRDTTLMLTQNTANPSPTGQILRQQQMPDPGNEPSSQARANTVQNQSAVPSQLLNQGQNEYNMRYAYRSKLEEENVKTGQRVSRDFMNNFGGNGENWINKQAKPAAPGTESTVSKRVVGSEAVVHLSPMVPLWVQTDRGQERLMLLRMVRIEDKETCQGIVLDGPRLEELLAEGVTDLFPEARMVPVRETEPSQLERTMTALPFELDPGPADRPADPGWTPLRVGLSLAWSAAAIALLAVALGGWSLFDLSERRIRFVSAVTHELRTPLTTLRLYLDMLVGGMVKDAGQREEYLQTLNAETDRLNRLVSNVLDFSRLEKKRPQLIRASVTMGDLLAQVQATWQGRCHDAGKELLLESRVDPATVLCTDPALVQQILGNLLDNACKYSRGANDTRLWLRVHPDKGRIVFEVEDRGPGVPAAEQQSIFRAFGRGRQADVTAGGVGLGLALAQRWTRLLGGQLNLRVDGAEAGACFRVCLPMGGPVEQSS